MNWPSGGSTRGPGIQVSAAGADIPSHKTSEVSPLVFPALYSTAVGLSILFSSHLISYFLLSLARRRIIYSREKKLLSMFCLQKIFWRHSIACWAQILNVLHIILICFVLLNRYFFQVLVFWIYFNYRGINFGWIIKYKILFELILKFILVEMSNVIFPLNLHFAEKV